MKRILLILTATLTLMACTPAQVAWHIMVHEKIAAEADPVVKAGMQAEYDAVVANYEAVKAQYTNGHPCAQWFELAIEAGFTPQQWQEPVSRIMFRESGCNPRAQNSHSSAAGLMQELYMWLDDCGGTTKENFYDPWWNLQCAYHIYQVQGWNAWVTY